MKSGLLLLVFALILVSCSSTPRSGSRLPASPALSDTYLETDEVVALRELNALRVARGLGELSVDPILQEAAARHSQFMTDTREITHHEPSPMSKYEDRIGVNNLKAYEDSGEIIGCARSPEVLVELWSRSPGHSANMLKAGFNVVGVSRRGNGKRIDAPLCTFNNYWTMVFGRRTK